MNLNLVTPISNWIYLFPKITLLTNTRAGGTWICHLIYGHFCHWSIKHYNPVSKEPHSGQLVIAAWPPKCLRPCVSRKTFQNPRLQPRFFLFIFHSTWNTSISIFSGDTINKGVQSGLPQIFMPIMALIRSQVKPDIPSIDTHLKHRISPFRAYKGVILIIWHVTARAWIAQPGRCGCAGTA